MLSPAGEVEFGYREQFADAAVEIADCYASCPDADGAVWFSPYTEFPLVRLNVVSRTQEVFQIPEQVHGASGLSVTKDYVYFHSPYGAPELILAWNRASGETVTVGESPGALRGIAGGRFVGVMTDQVVVVTLENDAA